MVRKVLVVILGLVIILGGLAYTEMKLKNGGREEVGGGKAEQEQSEEVVRQDNGMERKEEVSEKDLDQELESVSEEIDQAINDLSEELVEPEADLSL